MIPDSWRNAHIDDWLEDRRRLEGYKATHCEICEKEFDEREDEPISHICQGEEILLCRDCYHLEQVSREEQI